MPKRKGQRLKGYDYSNSGAYFITICVYGNKPLLSKIVDSSRRDNPCGCPQVMLKSLGKICENTIDFICEKYDLIIEDYIIMPNHIHMISFIDESSSRTTARVVPTVSDVIGAYKSIVSSEWLKQCKKNNLEMGILWERSFYDHIIRNDEDYECKQRYINENPIRWSIKYHL